MRKLGLMPLIAAALMVSATVSFAQNNTPPANAVENPATTPQHSSGSGTAPENMGATGWTGGSRGQTHDSATTTGQTTPAQDAEAAKDQPVDGVGRGSERSAGEIPAQQDAGIARKSLDRSLRDRDDVLGSRLPGTIHCVRAAAARCSLHP